MDGVLPTVSVIMPLYNCAAFLDQCLPPLFQQTYPLDRYEVLLIDDGSTDDTVRRARQIAAGWAGRFQLIEQPNSGPASARLKGLHASDAEIIAFIDADCVVAADWLTELIGALLATGADGIGGPIIGGDINNWVAHYLEAVRFYRHRLRQGQVDYLVMVNTAFRRSALLTVNSFAAADQHTWAEDADLSYKLKDAGYRLTVTERAPMIHYGTLGSVRSLASKLYTYGRGNALRSRDWGQRRPPWRELSRHSAAVVLAPWIALRRTHGRVSLLTKLSFWPLIMIEHAAFVAGMVSVLLAGSPRQ